MSGRSAHDVEIGRVIAAAERLGGAGLAVAGSGNISTRVADGLLITASGARLDRATYDDICHVTGAGDVATGTSPSSELELHQALYRHPRVNAVIHLHGAHSTAAGLIGDELPALHYSIHRLGGPVPVVPYLLFGSSELAAAVADVIHNGKDGVLLRNHGSVVVGTSVEDACEKAELLEWLSVIHLAMDRREPHVLTPQELDAVRTKSAEVAYGRSQR